MARPKELVDEALVTQARKELNALGDHQLCIRLQAIISCADHAMSTVASVMGISPSTLRRWARSFRQAGLAGLRDKPKGHRPAKLDSEQRAQVKQWVERSADAREQPVHWTLEKLAAEIERVFGVHLTLTPLWRWVRTWGFRQKVPRPHHAQADPEAQATFKKKSFRR